MSTVASLGVAAVTAGTAGTKKAPLFVAAATRPDPLTACAMKRTSAADAVPRDASDTVVVHRPTALVSRVRSSGIQVPADP